MTTLYLHRKLVNSMDARLVLTVAEYASTLQLEEGSAVAKDAVKEIICMTTILRNKKVKGMTVFQTEDRVLHMNKKYLSCWIRHACQDKKQ